MKGDSPFQKKRTEFKREPTTYESFRDYAVARLDKMFLDYLPSDDIKAMSPEYLYPIGGMVFLCLIGIFLSVFLNGYYSAVNREYLSPFTGKTASKNCITIPTVNTGTYLATQQGSWQGADGFQFGKATYELTTVSTSFSYDEYEYLMNKVYSSLQFIKNISVNYDLASNLVYWMSSMFVPYPGNTAQRLTFMGTPQVVFNRQKIVGMVSNVEGDCNVTSTAAFNTENGLLSISYDYEEYVNNRICNDSVSPSLLSYLPSTDNGYFSFHLDTRSIITALAVNMGIIEVDNLVSIAELSSVYVFEGVSYNVSVYYDPKYNGMEPISCINVNTTVHHDYSFCIIKVQNELYAIPLFNHYGMSEVTPTPCNCSTIDPTDLQNAYFSCNLFSFMTGVLFYPTNSPDEIMRMWLNIGLTTINQVLTSPVNNYAFDAQYIASYWGQNSPDRALFETSDYRDQAYAFCNVTGNNGPCSLITFSIFDKTPQNWAVTDYYYQLINGACANTFVPDYDEWYKLIDTPFAPLNQDYQKCHYEHSTVIINQAGSSVGNVSILAPVCIACILVLVYFAQVCGVASIKKTYTNSEKENALSEFALRLLLARDKDNALVDRDSVLAQLVAELGQELDSGESIYRDGEGRGGKPSVTIDWAALQTSVGLKKRQPSVVGTTRDRPTTSVASVSDSPMGHPEDGSRVSSPFHFADAASAMMAEQRRFTIMNDYEVTSALIQLCGTAPGMHHGNKSSPRNSPRNSRRKTAESKATAGSADDQMEAGTAVTSGKAEDADVRLDVEALLALMSELIETLEAEQLRADRSQNIWSVVSQTAILRTVSAPSLPATHQSRFYFKLHTLLALHSAVMMNIPLAEVKQRQADSVAYMVGQEVLTLTDIRARL